MNIALLFNSGAPEYDGNYGRPIERKVFETAIMQASERHMKISAGDVLIRAHSKSWAHYDELCERVYFAASWALLHEARLRATFRKSKIYAVVAENMTRRIAEDLHKVLTPDESYLGLQSVDYSYDPHLVLYRNCMVPLYRIKGNSCWVLFSTEDGDIARDAFDAMRKAGFDRVRWEDCGAYGTILDDYDTVEHFRQVANFRAAVAQFLANGEDDAYELVMIIEDLSPALFNVLGAAVDALGRARTEEHVAHVALSGRRYMDQLADLLFPPQEKKHIGRKMGKAEYKNRIWAFITDNVGSDDTHAGALGRETDRLVEEFNACLHGQQPADRVLRALVDVAKLTATLLSLNPAKTRQHHIPITPRSRRLSERLLST